jgi:hypothetical protein
VSTHKYMSIQYIPTVISHENNMHEYARYVCMYVYIYIYICIHVCMYVCIHTHICTYIHTYTQLQQGWVVLCPPATLQNDVDQGRIRISAKFMPSQATESCTDDAPPSIVVREATLLVDEDAKVLIQSALFPLSFHWFICI